MCFACICLLDRLYCCRLQSILDCLALLVAASYCSDAGCLPEYRYGCDQDTGHPAADWQLGPGYLPKAGPSGTVGCAGILRPGRSKL